MKNIFNVKLKIEKSSKILTKFLTKFHKLRFTNRRFTHFIILRHNFLQNDIDFLAYIPMLPNITNL